MERHSLSGSCLQLGIPTRKCVELTCASLLEILSTLHICSLLFK
jgi:hypothetical protein